jgi:hypothetical protein
MISFLVVDQYPSEVYGYGEEKHHHQDDDSNGSGPGVIPQFGITLNHSSIRRTLTGAEHEVEGKYQPQKVFH